MAILTVQILTKYFHYLFLFICRAYKLIFSYKFLVHDLRAVKITPKFGTGKFRGCRKIYMGGLGDNFFCVVGEGVTKNYKSKNFKLYCKIEGSIWFIYFFLLKGVLLSWNFLTELVLKDLSLKYFFWYFKT